MNNVFGSNDNGASLWWGTVGQTSHHGYSNDDASLHNSAYLHPLDSTNDRHGSNHDNNRSTENQGHHATVEDSLDEDKENIPPASEWGHGSDMAREWNTQDIAESNGTATYAIDRIQEGFAGWSIREGSSWWGIVDEAEQGF